jgi:hypothetical protein
VGELAVQDQEREAAEVVAVQVRHQHQPNLAGILALLVEGDQGRGAAVQQHIAVVVARGVQQDAGLEAAAAAEGVTGANEPHLDGVGGHALTLPCIDRPDVDIRQAGTRSASLGKAKDSFDWRLLTRHYSGTGIRKLPLFADRKGWVAHWLEDRNQVEAGSRSPRRRSAAVL